MHKHKNTDTIDNNESQFVLLLWDGYVCALGVCWVLVCALPIYISIYIDKMLLNIYIDIFKHLDYSILVGR